MHSEILLEQFKLAAGEAALCELHLRLLAGKVPELRDCALAPKSFEIEKRVKEHFQEVLTDEDRTLMEQSRQLRNKLLHGDFQPAGLSLQRLGAQQRNGGIRRVEFEPGTDASDKLKVLAEGLSGTKGQLVADSSSTQEGTVYGWLLEFGFSGDLTEAYNIFVRMIALIRRLLDMADSPISPGRASSDIEF